MATSRSNPSTLSNVSRFVIRAAAIKKRQERTLLGKRGSGVSPSRTLMRTHRISQQRVDGSQLWFVRPKRERIRRKIFYLHGGAYVKGPYLQHWRFIAYLADKLQAEVAVPDYPLAPNHHAAETCHAVLAAYAMFCSQNDGNPLILMGDSAGGGLALALTGLLEKNSLPPPLLLVLLSPWIDLTLDNPEIDSLDREDPVLDREILRKAGRLYAGERSLTDPCVSPLYGDLAHLPPTALFVGTSDILLADSRRLVSRAAQAGSPIDLYEITGLVHPGVLLPIPERSWIVGKIDSMLAKL